MKAKRQKANLKAIKKKFPACAAHLDLFESIQDAVYSANFSPPPKLDPEELRQAFSEGKAVLDLTLSRLDAKAFVTAMEKLFRLLERRNPEEFSKATHRAISECLMADYLCARSVKRHAKEQGISTATFVSCCQQAARPQLVALREANAGADLGAWSGGHCPFCGALPAFAEIESSGLRFLFCPNCLGKYRFSRHYCPGCGHAGLNVLQMDAWPGLLLESCPGCGTYLKTWSDGAGVLPCPFPHLDIVTRDVDEAAGLQDLKRLSLSVMGV